MLSAEKHESTAPASAAAKQWQGRSSRIDRTRGKISLNLQSTCAIADLWLLAWLCVRQGSAMYSQGRLLSSGTETVSKMKDIAPLQQQPAHDLPQDLPFETEKCLTSGQASS